MDFKNLLCTFVLSQLISFKDSKWYRREKVNYRIKNIT